MTVKSFKYTCQSLLAIINHQHIHRARPVPPPDHYLRPRTSTPPPYLPTMVLQNLSIIQRRMSSRTSLPAESSSAASMIRISPESYWASTSTSSMPPKGRGKDQAHSSNSLRTMILVVRIPKMYSGWSFSCVMVEPPLYNLGTMSRDSSWVSSILSSHARVGEWYVNALVERFYRLKHLA